MSNQHLLKGRLTNKKLVIWLNAEFKRLEMDRFVVTKIEATRYRADDYEAGACKLYVRVEDTKYPKHDLIRPTFYCFYSIKEYEQYMKQGWELYLKLGGRFNLIKDLEVHVRKP